MRSLGVERTSEGFVLALLDTGTRSPELVGSWDVPAPADGRAEALRAAIEACVDGEPDAIATALPEDQVTHRILHLPFTEAARLNATVPFELESLVPFDLGDAVTTYTVLGKEDGSDLLAALVGRQALAADLAELETADVDPAVVDVGAFAIAGLVRAARSDALVVEPRPGGAVALLRDGKLAGLHVLSGADGEDPAQEIRWLALTLAGDGPLPPIVEIPTSGRAVDAAAVLNASALPLSQAVPPWAARADVRHLRAVALAARGAGLVSTGANFRTGDFVYHAPSEEAHRQLRLTAIVAAVTLVLGLASYGVVLAERNAELDALRAEIRQAVTPIVASAPVGQERIRLEGAVQGLERRRAMLGGASSARPPVLDVLRLIGKSVPSSTPFQVEEVAIDAESVRFRGRTDSYESVDVIKQALHDLPGAQEPDVRDVKKGIDDRIEFRTAIDFDDGAPR